MLDLILKYKTYLLGIALGAFAGFLYWRFVGCSSGTCAITSNWYTSAGYGALMGVLISKPKKKKKVVKEKE